VAHALSPVSHPTQPSPAGPPQPGGLLAFSGFQLGPGKGGKTPVTHQPAASTGEGGCMHAATASWCIAVWQAMQRCITLPDFSRGRDKGARRVSSSGLCVRGLGSRAAASSTATYISGCPSGAPVPSLLLFAATVCHRPGLCGGAHTRAAAPGGPGQGCAPAPVCVQWQSPQSVFWWSCATHCRAGPPVWQGGPMALPQDVLCTCISHPCPARCSPLLLQLLMPCADDQFYLALRG
jgi:hypothetical protein